MTLMRLARFSIGMAVIFLSGCAAQPYWPHQDIGADGSCSPRSQAGMHQDHQKEAQVGYALHFVEFDDQGWLYPNNEELEGAIGTPDKQIDCAIDDILNSLKKDENNRDGKVLAIVYVHGWKHNARPREEGLQEFEEVLRERVKVANGRRVVGIYVGWQGKTLDLPLLRELTFWGRKNAAEHVADGRVRELFSRIKGLREYWNGPREQLGGEEAKSAVQAAKDCDWDMSKGDQCPLRTIMIGHSFGGLIMFNSVVPHLVEMLTANRDLPVAAQTSERMKAKRARGVADLIILLNPAFEGSRYEPLYKASQEYRGVGKEPPILVSVTSTADWATRKAFPVARWFNTIFQYPATSEDESITMKRTPGHSDRYITHDLCLLGENCTLMQYEINMQREASKLPTNPWSETSAYCNNLVLRLLEVNKSAGKSIIWNIRTNKEIIKDHSDITGEVLKDFLGQIYGTLDGSPNTTCAQKTPSFSKTSNRQD